MKRPRVLLLEDRPNVLKAMASVLENGYDVTAATGASAALPLIDSSSFDVLLTDIRVLGATGLEVLQAVQDRAPHTAVVMISSNPSAPGAPALDACDGGESTVDATGLSLVLARAVDRSRDEAYDELMADALPSRDDAVDLAVGFHRAVEAARQRASRDYLVRLMRLFRGNVNRAAAHAAMTRESLYRVLRQFDVQAERYKPRARVRQAPRASGGSPLQAVPAPSADRG